MTPDIDIHAKSDRELLIMVVNKLNGMCDSVEKHERTLYNNGFGIAAQVRVLWILALGIWSIFLVWARKVL